MIAAIARFVASDVAFTTLTADVRAVAPSINAETISTYVGLLERMFIVTGTGPIITLDDGTVTCPLRALAP